MESESEDPAHAKRVRRSARQGKRRRFAEDCESKGQEKVWFGDHVIQEAKTICCKKCEAL